MIELVVVAGRLHLDVSESEIARRRGAWKPPQPTIQRGYYQLYHEHVMQADRGSDLDFLVGKSGAGVPRECY
jgi:dihydroxy-acid dehydratase